ncbi:MAG: hypothetical protein IT383_05530 [Deltaproteobacteria bacterium]|nr:hypothetical protein [Deltaproteobacteria bacterium]
MVPVTAPARTTSLRRAAVPAEAARCPPTAPPRAAALLALLLPACSMGMPESDTLAEPSLPIEALTIVDGDVIYTDADDEDPDIDGLQITLRVEVADEAIERVVLYGADGTDLSEPVHTDLDGARGAFFLVTLPYAENPVRVAALVLPAEARAVVRTVRGADAR